MEARYQWFGVSRPETILLFLEAARRVERYFHLTQIFVRADSELHTVVWQYMGISLGVDVGLWDYKLLCPSIQATAEHTHKEGNFSHISNTQ